MVDSVSQAYEKPPSNPRTRVRADEKVRLNWSVNGIQDSAGTYIPSLQLTGLLDRTRNTLDLTASFPRTPQRWREIGTCTTRTQ